jgi:hypothetical protein
VLLLLLLLKREGCARQGILANTQNAARCER